MFRQIPHTRTVFRRESDLYVLLGRFRYRICFHNVYIRIQASFQIMRETSNINKKNQEQRKRRVLQDILSRTDSGGAPEKM